MPRVDCALYWLFFAGAAGLNGYPREPFNMSGAHGSLRTTTLRSNWLELLTNFRAAGFGIHDLNQGAIRIDGPDVVAGLRGLDVRSLQRRHGLVQVQVIDLEGHVFP